ncbi:Ribosomal protein L7Ae/L30e/S12e/Gadd45 family [Novymonas esmeraldas]|uniref:Ribosomal protein L7Ae/L30e/S12e/Gadd45 family n=1 Tax=Novymonas esmeraldas TaxID=1808958 RepID=A0AAW0ENK3_9TRYP
MSRPRKSTTDAQQQQQHPHPRPAVRQRSASSPSKPQQAPPLSSLTHTTGLPLAHRHRRVGVASAALQRRVKRKTSDPNADTVFNHRARFTKLKRTVHAQRQWVLHRALGTQEPTSTSPAVAREHVGSSSSHRSSSARSSRQWDSDEEEDEDRDAGNTASATVCVGFSPAAVQRTVVAMTAMYGRLDAAMKAREYARAAALKRRIRARQRRLHRDLRVATSQHCGDGSGGRTYTSLTLPDTEAEGRTRKRCAAVPGSSGGESPTPYQSFHPPTTWLGVGRHPRSSWVDQRSGRYPQLCNSSHLQAVARHFMDGEVADVGALPDDCASLVLATSSPAPSPAALSRSRRAMKASLFVAAYCANVLTDALDDLCFTLLQGLYSEQRDLRQKQPLQFKARQRYVVGFQEVLKCLKAGRVRLVLLAADVEAVDVVPSPPSEANNASAAGAADPALSTASPHTRPPSKPARRKAFQSLHEAVQLVQQLSGVGHSTANALASAVVGTRAPPLCLTCMSRQRLSYALYAKGSKVGCVAVLQAEKNRDALKAVMCYGRYLTSVYASAPTQPTTTTTTMADGEGGATSGVGQR